MDTVTLLWERFWCMQEVRSNVEELSSSMAWLPRTSVAILPSKSRREYITTSSRQWFTHWNDGWASSRFYTNTIRTIQGEIQSWTRYAWQHLKRIAALVPGRKRNEELGSSPHKKVGLRVQAWPNLSLSAKNCLQICATLIAMREITKLKPRSDGDTNDTRWSNRWLQLILAPVLIEIQSSERMFFY